MQAFLLSYCTSTWGNTACSQSSFRSSSEYSNSSQLIIVVFLNYVSCSNFSYVRNTSPRRDILTPRESLYVVTCATLALWHLSFTKLDSRRGLSVISRTLFPFIAELIASERDCSEAFSKLKKPLLRRKLVIS